MLLAFIRLREWSLSHVVLDRSGCEQLCATLKSLSLLQRFRLADCTLDTSRLWESLSLCIHKLDTLAELKISAVLDDEAVILLLKHLRDDLHLVSIDLSGCAMRVTSIEKWKTALRDRIHLAYFILPTIEVVG